MTVPLEIYLQIWDEDGNLNEEPSWSDKRVYASDIKYVLASDYTDEDEQQYCLNCGSPLEKGFADSGVCLWCKDDNDDDDFVRYCTCGELIVEGVPCDNPVHYHVQITYAASLPPPIKLPEDDE